MDKFIFKGDEKLVGDITVRRIRAVRSFGGIQEGELGGWLETVSNLSSTGNAWVAGEAVVMAFAQVQDDALVKDSAMAAGWARIRNNAIVADSAIVEGVANIMGGYIGGDNLVRGDCIVTSTPEYIDALQ